MLGKQVSLVVAHSGAKPNEAIQEQQTFINDNKIVAMTGSTSSAVAVALNKFAEREKIIYSSGAAISGFNRHHRQGLFGVFVLPVLLRRYVANAIGPVLVKNFGKNRKAAYMTPITHGSRL